MNKIKSVIIDDEINNCKNLENLLQRYCNEVEVLGMAHGALDGIDLIKQLNPELVFLDIRMPDGTGFDLLDHFTQPDFDVIFITAYDQYAIKAIRMSAIDYLLKPVNIMELKTAISRAIEKQKGSPNEQLLNYLENQQRQGSDRKIALPTAERILFVQLHEIIRCQGENNYTHIYLTNGDHVLVSKTLKEYEELLGESGFIRVHQSHLINREYIRSYEKQDGGYIKMTDDSTISISRQRKENVLRILKLK
ncbi:response regulator transcription factor [Puteibacter caeruleilacunae]|nr:response regulator transcription factor [Puteibacter caeruleilacunae]